ncbi:exodeoxyribonuclease V subunit alpha [Marinobacterium sediminicola]|uniref:RecBCD enzyme subunit RecD n=1 Tax=Marinobacterium sediminicola TaxID=518898 RepID=A0ABY1S2M3_9GAMM|nr:exodeoxyribonuclease V subunit alpha [Marinobacterium sediminicola]ULG68874.1 exodeoxyribonuclease V subunit alpha [Marinobacterium sediminicola]SMR77516.1 DNA helicase/exodeoxyribonuclease V, alpha subunit [Marinobacterium sediminicola]
MAEQNDLFATESRLHAALTDWPSLEHLLQRWQARGWIRALDLALGRFLQELEPDTSPLVLLAGVLASHQLGRGHICADIDNLLSAPDTALSLPPDGEFGEALPDRPVELLQGVGRSEWLAALRASSLVGAGDPATPLVLEPESTRLYLYRQWRYEVQVAERIAARLSPLPQPAAGLKPRLSELFAPVEGRLDWQQLACALVAGRRFGIITGGPGTGKTTTVVRLLALLQSLARDDGRALRIRLAAPTGKAAARLTESISGAVGQLPPHLQQDIPLEVTTLHRLLGARPGTRRFVHHADNPLHADLIVVDEASMIDLEMMHQLLSALPNRARLILLGDKDQLASVEAGSVLGDLCEGADLGGYTVETLNWLEGQTDQAVAEWQAAEGETSSQPLAQSIAMLRYSHRFGADSGIGALARAVNSGQPEQVQQVLQAGYADLGVTILKGGEDRMLERLVLEGGHQAPAADGTAPEGYRHYLQQLAALRPAEAAPESLDHWAREILEAFGRFQLLCALRRGPWGVEGLNDRIATALMKAGLIERSEGWYEGRPVLVTRNDYGLGLMNGDIGITLAIPDGRDGQSLRVVFPLADGSLKWVLPSRLQAIETVYAMTVHKSQGSEFAHTALLLPPTANPVLTRELVYTGITRASRWFSLLLAHRGRLDDAVRVRVRRASGLRSRLTESGSMVGDVARFSRWAF